MQLSTMNTIKCFNSLILKDNINIMYTCKIHVFKVIFCVEGNRWTAGCENILVLVYFVLYYKYY